MKIIQNLLYLVILFQLESIDLVFPASFSNVIPHMSSCSCKYPAASEQSRVGQAGNVHGDFITRVPAAGLLANSELMKRHLPFLHPHKYRLL